MDKERKRSVAILASVSVESNWGGPLLTRDMVCLTGEVSKGSMRLSARYKEAYEAHGTNSSLAKKLRKGSGSVAVDVVEEWQGVEEIGSNLERRDKKRAMFVSNGTVYSCAQVCFSEINIPASLFSHPQPRCVCVH